MRVARAKIHERYTKDFEDLMTKDGLPKIRNLPGNMGGYLAKAGVNCAIFERDIFPRPHVGESLVPASNRVFDELGLFEKF